MKCGGVPVGAMLMLLDGGCSHGGGVPTTTDHSSDAAAAVTLTFAMGATVPAGADLYRCKLVVSPNAPSFAVHFAHTYSAGVHHVFVLRTDLTSLPSETDTEADCYAGSPSLMDHARANLYGAETPSGSLALPPGVALPLVAGEVLLLQAHYLNATSVDVEAQAALSVDLAANDLPQHAGAFFFYDPFIDVPPGRLATASMRCAVPQAVTVLTTVGSAHSRAIDFAAYVDPPSGPGAGGPYYHAPGWANPLPLQTNLDAPAGGHLRFSCSYDNTHGTTEYLQGTSFDTAEQCTLSGLYVPELGIDFDRCGVSADGFGTGTGNCSVTRACIAACPPGSAPPLDLGLGGEPAVDPCWQRCIAASCPTSTAFYALQSCLAANCASACSGDAGAACASCTQTHCATESSACDAETCP